jgi:amino acid adenylation domain-containing protein
MVQHLKNFSDLVELLRYRARHQPEKVAFRFLGDGETEEATLTYGELDCRSRAIAAQLQAVEVSGERALLLYPPSLDYLATFFGCLYAGVVAVPAYPPRNQRNTPRIKALLADAQAPIILTTTTILSGMQSFLAKEIDLDSIQWLTTDNISSDIEANWQEPIINRDTLAFLQYTSGSTGVPKGVMLTHSNLLHNAVMTYRMMEHSPNSTFVSWLPTYHDMGLIGGILQPLYGGFPCVLMPPTAFLARPYRWLQAISRYRGTTSGAPNFAYELCIEKITPQQRESLDLSSWTVAFNGAEPVRRDTLERFAEAFKSCGFRRGAFYPCYGMAEATLMISGGVKAASPVYKTVRKKDLECDRIVEDNPELSSNYLLPSQNSLLPSQDIQTFVGCGQTLPEQTIVIAHPENLTRCQSNEVGEIWVCGASIGLGYWNRPEETAQTFGAYLSDTGEGPFLRTGDLGFWQDGELFITGRAKDLIIIRGRNLYPQDIELTASNSHSSLRANSSAAFCVEVDNEERLVVVQELEFRAKPNLEEVIAAIRGAIFQEYEVQAYAVVLIKAGTIPKTSSGKIQRRACREQFLAGSLSAIASSILDNNYCEENEKSPTLEDILAAAPEDRKSLLESYLKLVIARLLKVDFSHLNWQQSLSAFGFDSLMVFALKNQLEVDLGVDISVADLFESASLDRLAEQVLHQLTFDPPLPPFSKGGIENLNSLREYPLSFAQQQFWFLYRLSPGNSAYNVSLAIDLQGVLNVPLLEESFNRIVGRHDILRTSFIEVNGQPVQVIAPSISQDSSSWANLASPTPQSWEEQMASLSLPVIDCQSLTEAEIELLVKQAIAEPFDLSRAPLLRAQLLRLREREHRLILCAHHIIADGGSIELLLQELAAFYQNPASVPELSIQYADFAYWQRQWFQGEVLEKQLAYWREHLAGAAAILPLPTDKPRPTVQTYRGKHQSLVIPAAVTERLKALAQQEGVTLFMLLLAAFQTLLYRYTGQEDISIGSPISHRNREETKSLIGLFINTIVLRSDLSGNPTFRELLARVRQVALGAYAHADLPFDRLVDELQPQRDPSYSPLFQVMFDLQMASGAMPYGKATANALPDLLLKPVKVQSDTAAFDLSLILEVREQELVGSFEYNTDLFDSTTIARMAGHFQNLLAGIIVDSEQRLSQLPLLTAAETQQLLVEWNATQRDYSQDSCIHQLFEAQVERTPNAIPFGSATRIAIVYKEQQLTYRELNQKSDRLARYLRSLGVTSEMLVGICIERSPEMIVGLLAILKAGGAYLPLDPTYPKERLAFMLEDAQVSVLLTRSQLVTKLPEHNAKLVCLDTDWEAQISSYNEQDAKRPECKRRIFRTTYPDNLAYVIYTSGSTGTPKGVAIAHRSLVNYIHQVCVEYEVTEDDLILQFSSISFDVAAEEIFCSLTKGATLILRTDEMLSSIPAFLQQCQHFQATVLILPTAFWHQLTVELSQSNLHLPETVRLVVIGGEEALSDRLKIWQERVGKRVRLLNNYGLTETTIGATICDLSNIEVESKIPIGKALGNTQIYVLDSYQQPVPIGVPGELYIGGLGIARGYLNRAEITPERFISNPFKNSERLYKTGDLVRYKIDGNLDFLGRIDDQVKIRGFRIELGEIETILRQHPEVREAVVVARKDGSGDRRLVAYIIPEKQQQIIELRQFLQGKLPDYAIPTAFVYLESLLLTSSGKVNRKELPKPDNYLISNVSFVPPETELEELIASIWRSLLGVEKVGIHDNFFDLGGHSLLITQVNAQLREQLERDISVVEMFQYPTINLLATHLDKNQQKHNGFARNVSRAEKQKAVFKRQAKRFSQGGK